MAETLVEKKICDACGAEVRAGSLFCYNCGGAVVLDLPDSEKNKKEKISDAWLQGDLTKNSDLKTTQLKKEAVEKAETPPITKQFTKPIDKPVDKPTVGELLKEIEPKPIEKPIEEKPSVQEETKLKSAASMRRKAKTYQKKTVEIVWEEPESAPNKWFVVVAVVLILLVVGIFYLAMYLH